MNEKKAYNKYITIGGMPLLPDFNVIKETEITKLSQPSRVRDKIQEKS